MGAQEAMTFLANRHGSVGGMVTSQLKSTYFSLPKLFPQLDLGVPACKAGHLPRRVNEGLGFLHSGNILCELSHSFPG